jgi:NAD(P)H-dependent FMN reductase
LPETVRQLKQLLRAHDGWLIASPEYNSSFSGVLKNAIDWASRQQTDEEPPLACFVGKVAALMSASAGAHGGIRGLIQLRTTLSNIRVLVLPEQITIARAPDAFNNDGSLKDAKQQASVEKLGAMLTDTLRKLKAA